MYVEQGSMKETEQVERQYAENENQSIQIKEEHRYERKNKMERLWRSAPDLDVADIQHIMGISRASAYELVHTPGFPAVRSGRLIKISKKAFFNWLDSGGNSHENEKERTA